MGATTDTATNIGTLRFQSSPTPKDGCNASESGIIIIRVLVSILTHPEGWVQPAEYPSQKEYLTMFQSSPTPKDGCNEDEAVAIRTVKLFQSSPTPKDGCNCSSSMSPSLSTLFQSSPTPKDGCNQATHSVVRELIAGFNPHPPRRMGATRC